jgi:S1-C subfamily serine protease
MRRSTLLASLFITAFVLVGARAENAATEPVAPPAPPPVAKASKQLSVVRVNVTTQPWDFLRPWGKRPPFSRRAIGAVLAGGKVLITAEMVANGTYLEFESPEGGAKVPATVDAVDYEANLALLKTEDAAFLKNYQPIGTTAAKVGDTLSIWQLESTGTLLVTPGTMTSAEVSRYPVADTALLVYRLTANLQSRDSSFTLPVVKDGQLAGILMRFDNNSKNTELVPAPIIEHFLKDAAKGQYAGFPRAGMTFSPTRDPMFRRFLGLVRDSLPKANGGVYVTQVLRGSPAAKAGLQEGDTILRVGGEAVDQDGNYEDPEYGKLAVSHFLAVKNFVGDNVKFDIMRNGEPKELTLTLDHRAPEEYVSDPYIIDRAPRFYIFGGFVLQELSRQYLKEFGADWQKRAPEDLVYLDRYQSDLFAQGPKKIVILSRVLPSDVTIGFEQLRGLVVTKVNGEALDSLSDLPAALAKAENGLHKIEFDGEPHRVWIDAAAAEALGPVLKQSYRIPILHRLN